MAVSTAIPKICGAVGETTGFMLEWAGQKNGAFYISGDTVWVDEIEDIARRYNAGTGILHMGAANVPAVGDIRLTMNGEEGARVAKVLGLLAAYPAHFSSEIGARESDYPGTMTALPTEACNACHEANGGQDWVFTQLYPVLRAAMPNS